MAKNLRGKRPCSICRKWFQPDVRQIGRQKTCSPDCQYEHHRRQCEEWDKKNKEYFINIYLAKKIEPFEKKQSEKDQSSESALSHLTSPKQIPPKPKRIAKPVLPCEIIVKEYGEKDLIVIQYLVHQIIKQTNCRITGFT
jgi:hypothetical protein